MTALRAGPGRRRGAAALIACRRRPLRSQGASGPGRPSPRFPPFMGRDPSPPDDTGGSAAVAQGSVAGLARGRGAPEPPRRRRNSSGRTDRPGGVPGLPIAGSPGWQPRRCCRTCSYQFPWTSRRANAAARRVRRCARLARTCRRGWRLTSARASSRISADRAQRHALAKTSRAMRRTRLRVVAAPAARPKATISRPLPPGAGSAQTVHGPALSRMPRLRSRPTAVSLPRLTIRAAVWT